MKKHYFLIVIFILFSTFTTSAQTIRWMLKPNYDSIGYYSKEIFNCSTNNKIQLIDYTGKTLLPAEVDSITVFTEGIALALDKKGADYQIKGFLLENNHDFLEVKGNFFATFYSHFSEGLLAVADEKGNQGYLNTRGTIGIPCNYKKARPFVQGWACVESKKEGTAFIDKEGTYMIVQFHYGNLSIGTNFNEKGEALVGYTKNGQNDFAVINTSGKTIRTYTNRKGKPYRDYDFAFNEGVADLTQGHNDTPIFDSNITVFSSEGHFGYKNNDQALIAPAQFSYACPFADSYAIVALGNKYGIVALVEGRFSSNIESADITIRANKANELHYTLKMPEILDPRLIEIRFDKGDGILIPIQLEHNTYTFVPFVDKNDKDCTLRAEVRMDGLLLWEETMTKKVNRANVGTLEFSTPSKASEYAGSNNQLKVRTIVTNKTDTPQTIAVTFAAPVFQSGSKNSLASGLSTQEATLAVGERREFSITFKVNERETVKTSVTVRAAQQPIGTKSANIELKPFDLIE